MARPRIEFDWRLFDKLCQLPSVISQEEICDIMGLSHDTIERRIKQKCGKKTRFAEYRKQKQSRFRSTLLAKQIETAMSGNVSMLIWLGKNYLGQRDEPTFMDDSIDGVDFVA